MTSLAGADLAALDLLSGRLRAVSAVLQDADDALAQGSRATSLWRGPASEHFAAALSAVRRRVRPVPPAYAQAAAALLTYGAAVAEVQFLLRRAAGLRNEAARLTAPAPLVGPDPAEALRWQAQQLERRAQLEHEDAAARAARAVRSAASSLPQASRGAGWHRFTADLVTGAGEQVLGLVGLGVLGARASAGVDGAREELWSAAKQSWRIWEPLEQVWRDVRDGRYGLAASGALGMAFVRRPRLVTDAEVAHGEALQAARWHALTERLPLMDAQPLRAGNLEARLFVQEAMGGHAVREHVAKSDAYLRWRAQVMGRTVSSFPDAVTAQACLNQLLDEGAASLYAAMKDPSKDTFVLRSNMHRVIGRVVTPDGTMAPSSTWVRAVFTRVDGGVILKSVYPEKP